jgi:hypothetical protein
LALTVDLVLTASLLLQEIFVASQSTLKADMRDRSEAVDILTVAAKIKGRDEHPAITTRARLPGQRRGEVCLRFPRKTHSVIISNLKSMDSANAIFVGMSHLELEDVIFLAA